MAYPVSVREVMSSDYLGVHEGEPLGAVAKTLADQREDTAVVLRGGDPIGLVTAVDLLGALTDGGGDEAIGSYMREPVTTIEPEATIEHAIDQLATIETDHLVVIDAEGTAVGVVDARALLAVANSFIEGHLEATVPPIGERSPPSMSEQGVCESCGRLTDTLVESDGSLVCSACAQL